MAIPTLEETVDLMKSQIVIDVLKGLVPVQVKSFGDLHDYVDANEYGGFCDDEFCDQLIMDFGGRDPEDGMPDKMMDYINDCQKAVDAWIREGGLTYTIDDRSWEDFSPYHYGELLIKYKVAMRALDTIQSSSYASAPTLRLIANNAYMEAK